MAISRPTISSTITRQATDLLISAKGYCNNDNNIDEAYVKIEVLKGIQKVLNELCGKEISDSSTRTNIEGILKKAQKKLIFAEKMRQYVIEAITNDNVIDPRLEKLMAKLTQMSSNPTHSTASFEKLDKWQTKLDRICQGSRASIRTLIKAKHMVRELDMALLKKSPQFVQLGNSLITATNADTEKSQRQSSVVSAIIYLDLILRRPDIRTTGAIIDPFMRVLNDSGMMAKSIDEKKTEWRISEQDAIQIVAQSYPYLSFAPVGSPEISYLPGANQQEIQGLLEGLINLQHAQNLISMGAFVGIGYQTVAIVFHSTGCISLYNPCGDAKRGFSYEANFGSVNQAAEFLKELTDEFDSIPPITFKPYCLKSGLTAYGAIQPPSSYAPHHYLGTPPFPPSMPYSTGHGPAPYFLNSTSSPIPSPFPQMLFMPVTPDQACLASQPTNTQVSDSEESSGNDSNVDTDDEPEAKNKTLVEMFPGMTGIKESIQALSQRTEEGFYQSLTHIHKMKGHSWTWVDGSSGGNLDRVYFHLYHIQDKETPEKIDRNDRAWGGTAFQTEAFSTPEQKLRAVQRVRIEQLLISLVLLIHGGEQATPNFIEALDEVEQLNLHPSDLPSGQTNAAHALYGKLYQVYAKAREEDPSLVDPKDEMFKGDFGRHAFCGDFGIPNFEIITIKALQELADDLQAAWLT